MAKSNGFFIESRVVEPKKNISVGLPESVLFALKEYSRYKLKTPAEVITEMVRYVTGADAGFQEDLRTAAVRAAGRKGAGS